ncbi:MAG: zinc ribbon domain-containing protein [Thaumarchaeota archaeon]|nr:zinc ribbon domain-containing protein [Nitrososphaerota archaeon]
MVEHAQENNNLSVKEFQEKIREGKIEGYKCSKCGHTQIDIIEFCPVCHSPDLLKTEFSGKGKVLTYTNFSWLPPSSS